MSHRAGNGARAVAEQREPSAEDEPADHRRAERASADMQIDYPASMHEMNAKCSTATANHHDFEDGEIHQEELPDYYLVASDSGLLQKYSEHDAKYEAKQLLRALVVPDCFQHGVTPILQSRRRGMWRPRCRRRRSR